MGGSAALLLVSALAFASGCPNRAAQPADGGAVANDGREDMPPREPARAPDRAASTPTATVHKARDVRPPAHGCVVAEEHGLGADFDRGHAGFLADRALVVAVARDRRTLTLLVRRDDGAFVQRATQPLEAAVSRAALHCEVRCTFSFVDERGRLVAITLAADRFTRQTLLASGADRRFAPALARTASDTLVAFTATRDEVMHTLVVGASGGVPEDLTPPGHGAAAPSFVLGAGLPTLVMIDARAGVSPLLEVAFDARGNAQPARVRTPVSQPSVPPLLAAVQLGEVEVFYRVIGKLAMTAIGRVPLRRATEPTPFLPSTGYGPLELAVAKGRESALVAVEVPTASPATAPRALSVRRVGAGEAREVLAPGGGKRLAHRPSLAFGPLPGRFLLVHTGEHTLQATLLSCDDAP